MTIHRKYYYYQCTTCREVFKTELNFYDEYGMFEKDKGPMCIKCRNKPLHWNPYTTGPGRDDE